MCFSAEASFAAGAVLFPAGLYCLHSASRKDPRFLALAALPLLFSIQQLCEGLVWIGLQHENMPLARGAALVFLFFALFVWPFWAPFSVSFIETRNTVKGLLSVVAVLALPFGWAMFAPVVLDADHRLGIHIMHHSIQYRIGFLSAFGAVAGECWRVLYLASICCPLLVSMNRHFRRFAIMLALSAVLSHVIFWYAFESVWCFFAAALSVQLCLAFRGLSPPVARPAGHSLAL